MKVILKQEVDKLGKTGDVVEVKDGYARNFLIPKKMVLKATPGSLKVIEEEKKISLLRQDRDKRDAEAMGKKLSSISCTVLVKTGEEDKLFGSVTASDIVRVLENDGLKIDKRQILLENPLKELGVYQVPVKLHQDVTAQLKVWVVKE